jgi:ATP-dependent protease ClpP protease subunit
MPIPNPRKDEKEKDFIGRCMADEIMRKDYDQKQRLAVCFSSWRKSKSKPSAVDITHKAMNAFEISLYGTIGESMFADSNGAKIVIDQIKAAGAAPIDLHIHSSGGSLFDGYTIYNALQAHTPGVTVYIDGIAASIAAYVAMAGKTINMAENAMMMIHNPTLEAGRVDVNKMQKQMALLDKVTKSYAEAFTRRGVLTSDQVNAMMDAETWLTADEALLAGLVDDITPEMALAANVDLSDLVNFKHVPEQLLSQAGTRPAEKQGAPKSPPKGYPQSRDQYADPQNYKYPIDTADHTRAAWSYINKPENRTGYSSAELTYIENRIKSAAKKFGITIAEDTKANFDIEKITMTTQDEQKITAQEPKPEPAPEPELDEPTPAAAELSVVDKLKSMLVPKTELLAEITGLKSQIEVRDASIAQLNAKVADLAHSLETYKAQASEIPQIKALIAQLEKEKTTVSAAAADQIAALGFPKDKLPEQVEDKDKKDAEKKDPKKLLEKLNAITDPREFTRVYREMENEIKAALFVERAAPKV